MGDPAAGIWGRPRIPVTLITGFLGAGKTTLVNHVLSEEHGVRAAVLVNDFGSINIDAELIVGVEGDTVNLANGCVCCTIRNDLLGACLRLLQRPELPEHLLVELSGVSDPVPALATFLETELAQAFALDSILTVVDAEQLPQLEGDMARLARSQLEASDVVVLNKVDLVSRGEMEHVEELVQLVVPGSRIIEATHGRIPLELIFAGGGDAGDQRCEVRGQQADRHAHDQTFATWTWTSEAPLSLPKLRSTLEQLPASIYRCKGLVHLEEIPVNRYVLQMVGRRSHLEESGVWGDEPPRSEIVLIGGRDGIDSEALRRAFDDCLGTGDDSRSPVLRLVKKLAPELMGPTGANHRPDPPPATLDSRGDDAQGSNGNRASSMRISGSVPT